jgi:hypothetical protein
MKALPHGAGILPAALILTLTTAPLCGDPETQPQIDFKPGLQGTFNADWQGLAGHTYFLRFSTDLVTWHYAPFIDFGDGQHRRGLAADAPKLFIRLHHGDFPGIDSLDDAMNADFDGDGLSNIFEVTHGYDPCDAESTPDGPDTNLDPDGDGLSNASEQTHSRNPMRKDHPAVKLSIVVGP